MKKKICKLSGILIPVSIDLVRYGRRLAVLSLCGLCHRSLRHYIQSVVYFRLGRRLRAASGACPAAKRREVPNHRKRRVIRLFSKAERRSTPCIGAYYRFF